MATNTNFYEEYRDLVSDNFPLRKLTSAEDRGGYLSGSNAPAIPKQYQKKFIHTPNGFAANYCEEY